MGGGFKSPFPVLIGFMYLEGLYTSKVHLKNITVPLYWYLI